MQLATSVLSGSSFYQDTAQKVLDFLGPSETQFICK